MRRRREDPAARQVMTCNERDTATPLTSVPLYVLHGARTFPNRPECVVGVTCAELFCGCSRVGGGSVKLGLCGPAALRALVE